MSRAAPRTGDAGVALPVAPRPAAARPFLLPHCPFAVPDRAGRQCALDVIGPRPAPTACRACPYPAAYPDHVAAAALLSHRLAARPPEAPERPLLLAALATLRAAPLIPGTGLARQAPPAAIPSHKDPRP